MSTVRMPARAKGRTKSARTRKLDPSASPEMQKGQAANAAVPPASSKARKTKAGKAPAQLRVSSRRKKAPAKRRTKASHKAARPASATPVVIALPYLPEPLVTAEPAIDLAAWSALAPPQPATLPLPRGRAPALHRSGGLLEAIADWLGSSVQHALRRIGQFDLPPKPALLRRLKLQRKPTANDELLRLREENERLRLQLESLLAHRSNPDDHQVHSHA